MYGGYNSDDDDYNPMRHMMEDPVHFQMYGYGGFGYDTSHVPPDEPVSALVNKVNEDSLEGVKRIVQKATKKKKAQVINHARRWTEVDYKMSGFTREYEWFDATALCQAAVRGNDEIVQYLLEEGADPTLMACPVEDMQVCALQAAEAKLQTEERIKSSINNRSRALLKAKRCVELLKAAKGFWEDAPYRGARYDKNARKEFTNKPTDVKGLLEALSAIPALPADTSGTAQQAKKKKPAAPTASSNNAASNSSNLTHVCADCADEKPKSEYSKTQWSKGSHVGKCKNCIDSTKKMTAVASATASAPAATCTPSPKHRKSEEDILGEMYSDVGMMSLEASLELTKLSNAIEIIKQRAGAHPKCSEALRDSLETIETAIMAVDVQLDAVSGMIDTSANVAERDGLIKHSADAKKASQRK